VIRDDTLFLSATDTTIGFLSRDTVRLDRAKRRPPSKHYIRVYPSLSRLGETLRVPILHRRRVRRSSKTTFIHPHGVSFRIVRDPRHLLLLDRLGWAYSSSANLSGAPFDEAYARSVADVVVEPLGKPGTPSRIYRMGKSGLRKIR
jgi:tRNA A37 threonylcarbamoyladenosine synthetase subunit TsaC/SUA5/YrdC